MIRIDQSRIHDEVLADIVRRIVEAIDPDQIILFGSRARGDARDDSDYDLLVIKESEERTLKLEQRAYRNMSGLVVPVDILVETPQQIDLLGSVPGPVYRRALQEGRIVYERS